MTPTIEKKDVHPLGIDICTISDNLLPFQSKGNAVSILPKREEAKKMSWERTKKTHIVHIAAIAYIL